MDILQKDLFKMKMDRVSDDIIFLADVTAKAAKLNAASAEANRLVLLKMEQTLTKMEQALTRLEQKRRSRLSTVALVVSIFAFFIALVRTMALLI